MPVTIVVGGQFGSEGKGKVVAHLCRSHQYDAVVRVGGPNSGHTVTIDNKPVALRQIPAGVVNPNCKLFIASGSLINIDILMEEINKFGLTPNELVIDRNAIIIEKEDIQSEEAEGLGNRIGSTCNGVGAAVAKRISRKNDVRLARDAKKLEPFIGEVSEKLMELHNDGGKILIEGTQGFGLSLYHSPYYPYVTSRDCSAAGFLSEVGISPLIVEEVIMVLRTFPIRVGGHSGPLPNEIDWETIVQESGYPYDRVEYTTVTNKRRRVARFDIELVKKAVLYNQPTQIALMGVDYFNYVNTKAKKYDDLTEDAKSFIENLEMDLGRKITLVGIGPTDKGLLEITNEKLLLN